MHQLFIEHRPQTGQGVSGDLTRHLYGRMSGRAAVVCDNPTPMMSAVRKQWMKAHRQIQRERSATLDASKIIQLTNAISHMLSLRFSARPPLEDMNAADISFATPEHFAQTAPIVQTIYVISTVSKQELHLITSLMPPRGLVVIYSAIE